MIPRIRTVITLSRRTRTSGTTISIRMLFYTTGTTTTGTTITRRSIVNVMRSCTPATTNRGYTRP